MEGQSFAIELRTRIYPTEARCYCAKCAIFKDKGQPKNPNFKYLPPEEFDKIKDHIVDDSVLKTLTIDEILKVIASIRDIDKCLEYFDDQKTMTDPTVKFYGEFIPSGFYKEYITPEERTIQKFSALHQCNNPSCKLEIDLAAKYPYTDQVVGRMVRSPEDLQNPDNVIKNVTKKHIGSTVRKDFKDVGEEKPDEKDIGKGPKPDEEK